jgi:hypothetical protein
VVRLIKKVMKPLGMESMKYNNLDLKSYGQQIMSNRSLDKL